MAFADDLLEQAKHLANREPKRPRQASLRRAVSTAYYALFHLLISDAIRNWRIASQRNKLARAFDHGTMKRACTAKKDELNRYLKTARAKPAVAIQRHMHTVVSTFVQAQQDRHTADYDNSEHWSKTDVITKIDAVTEAFQSRNTIRKGEAAQEFLISLLGLKER